LATGDVELRDVTKRYGDVVAVDAVSLQIRDGEFFALLGPSGCGKTTTLRLVAGFEQPTRGEVRISGEVVNLVPPYKRNVNTVFQSYALFPHMNVQANIAFGLKMKGVESAEIERRVAEMLDMVKLHGYGKRRPSQLSGGEQQRVALARALVNHPAILLLDEPLAALDLKLRKQMQVELKELQREVGITFIYVTHDQGEALALSERMAVMHKGKILQVGTPTEIYERPNCRFVADFIGTTNFFVGAVTAAKPQAVGVQMPGGWLVHAKPNGLSAPTGQVTVAVRPEKICIAAQPSSALANAVQGVVEQALYLGTSTQYTVKLPGAATAVVYQQNVLNGTARAFVAGDKVFLSWQPESVLLFPSEAHPPVAETSRG